MTSRAGRLLFVLLLGGVLACSGVAPDIDEVAWQLSVDVSPQNYQREVLSLFVAAQDQDGVNDLEEAYLIFLEDGTSWWLPNQTWRLQEAHNDYQWLSNTNIQPLENSVFPRGAYRVFLYDRAGQQARLDFYLKLRATDLSSLQVSRPTVTSSGLIVNQVPNDEALLLGYNFGGDLLFQQPLTLGLQDYQQLRQDYGELASLLISYRQAPSLLIRVGPYPTF